MPRAGASRANELCDSAHDAEAEAVDFFLAELGEEGEELGGTFSACGGGYARGLSDAGVVGEQDAAGGGERVDQEGVDEVYCDADMGEEG